MRSSSHHNQTHRRSSGLLAAAILAGLALGGFLLAARLVYRIGFPLDDAWIHQTYARNLAQRAEWSFIPGQPSAGSTAPLWSALLALGYWLRFEPRAWTFGMGMLGLLAVAWVGAELFYRLDPAGTPRAAWAGVFLIFEWHLVWAAGSGMETLLAALLALLALALSLRSDPPWFRIGMLIGLGAWVRPDEITLLGPTLWIALFRLWGEERPGAEVEGRGPERMRLDIGGMARRSLMILAGMLVFFVPYLMFNRLLAGAWWPNTFFAKQAEYAQLRQAPLVQRFLAQVGLPLVGAGVILLPGFVFLLARGLRERRWTMFAVPLWMAGYLFLYAWRLPATYQHGRYVMPAMPVYFVCGLAGMAAWLQLNSPSTWRRMISRTWLLTLAATLAAFYFVGARAYALDVAVIETEMTAAAQWVAENVEPDALVAAHDIGALGYFAGRNLVDLAGLVSPEVIPFIRDEARLADYLDQRGAAYLVTFPGWYPELTQRGALLFRTSGVFSPELGGENMSVYRWRLR